MPNSATNPTFQLQFRDVGAYIGKIFNINDLMKYELLKNPWTPGKG